MTIFFYLPVITPWWFDNIIVPMLRGLYGTAELHVMVAPLWRNTGIEGEQLAPLADLPDIHWHVVEDDEPAQFRTNGAATKDVLDIVAQIGPDITLARSADVTTPRLFPGTVRYIMEGGAAPFVTDPTWIILDHQPFAHGMMTGDAVSRADACAAMIDPLWRDAHMRTRHDVSDWRTALSLPATGRILGVPLHYEHEENFFLSHAAFPDSVALLTHLRDAVPDDVILAVSDHPLNRKYVDRGALHAFVADNANRMILCERDDLPGGATALLAAGADAMLSDASKVWSLAAFCGTPIVHIGACPVADWVHVGTDLSLGALRAADAASTRRWFGWHLGTRLIDPATLTLDPLIDHVFGRADDATIAANIAMLNAQHMVAA